MTQSVDIETTAAPSPRLGRHGTDRLAASLHIDGMSCASCVGRVERTMRKVPGIAAADVNLATARASLVLQAGSDRAGTLAAVQAAVAKAGYAATPVETRRADASDDHADSSLARDLVIAALFTLPVFIVEMGAHLIPTLDATIDSTIGARAVAIACFVATTIVLFGPGLRFYRKGVPALWRLAPDMNSLVVLGATAAWGFSTIATFAPERLPPGTAALYFDAAAMIVTLILLGRLLEARAKGRAGDAIARLVGLRAKTARVERDGRMLDIALDAVAIGDIVQVRPGETIPVDGTVRDGSSFVDESMITGEAVPTRKAAGAAVTGGTLNTSGSFTFVAEKVGAETMLARIIAMVETAQGAKLPIQATVDQVTRWFVPAVMAAAALTFVTWLVFGPHPALGLALVNAVSVLIIACPCAMGLATPVSIMVGTGRGADLGILFRRGDALQRLGDATTFAFDKTGTLTAGHPTLTNLECADSFERADVLAAVAAAETGSEHPIAAALVAAARAEGLSIAQATDFVARAGFGITATVTGRTIMVGSDRMMRDAGLDVSSFAATADAYADHARTPLYAAIDGRLAAIFAVADPVKPSTAAAIDALHRLGRRTAMITGDAQRTGAAIAAIVGIDIVVADVLPEGKVEAVRSLRGAGRIAFVGDGINDAPALAEADIGIAVGTGTDVAIESADVVLISGDLAGVATAVALSRATMRNIRQNLAWAFGYNIVLIPVAAGALYPIAGLTLSPMLAAGAMAFSSVFVLLNALRLKRFARAG